MVYRIIGMLVVSISSLSWVHTAMQVASLANSVERLETRIETLIDPTKQPQTFQQQRALIHNRVSAMITLLCAAGTYSGFRKHRRTHHRFEPLTMLAGLMQLKYLLGTIAGLGVLWYIKKEVADLLYAKWENKQFKDQLKDIRHDLKIVASKQKNDEDNIKKLMESAKTYERTQSELVHKLKKVESDLLTATESLLSKFVQFGQKQEIEFKENTSLLREHSELVMQGLQELDSIVAEQKKLLKHQKVGLGLQDQIQTKLQTIAPLLKTVTDNQPATSSEAVTLSKTKKKRISLKGIKKRWNKLIGTVQESACNRPTIP